MKPVISCCLEVQDNWTLFLHSHHKFLLLLSWYWNESATLLNVIYYGNLFLQLILWTLLVLITLCIKYRVTISNFIFPGNIYRRGAKRWRKIHIVNGHSFVAKRFSRVSVTCFSLCDKYCILSKEIFSINNKWFRVNMEQLAC